MKISRNAPKGKNIAVVVTYKCGCNIEEILKDGGEVPAYLEMCTKMVCKRCIDKERYLLDVLAGKYEIGEQEKQLFIKFYKEILSEGKYIGMREGNTVISSKFPERCQKQVDNFDEFIQNIFTVA